MSETIFLTYYWTTPTLWVILIIVNRLLENHIATLNDNISSSANPEIKYQTQNKIDFMFLLRALLAFPAMLVFWWVFTRLLNINEMYLIIAGYYLLSWINAITKQLSSLFLQFLFRYFKLDALFSKDELHKTANLNHVGSAAEYFSYFLIYLLVVILTQSWFFAGGVVACLFAIGKHLVKAHKMVQVNQNQFNRV